MGMVFDRSSTIDQRKDSFYLLFKVRKKLYVIDFLAQILKKLDYWANIHGCLFLELAIIKAVGVKMETGTYGQNKSRFAR